MDNYDCVIRQCSDKLDELESKNDLEKKNSIILGIDIGTSSVKSSIVQIIDNVSYNVLSSSKCSYDRARIQNANKPGYSELDVFEILKCFYSSIEKLENLNKIQTITFSCQMHGIILWNTEKIFLNNSSKNNSNFSFLDQFNFDAVSNLYDWTDQRCTPEFLSKLPVPQSYADQPSTGYGCVTLFWLQEYEPELLQKYNTSSTIGDFIAWLLCCSITNVSKKAFISTHNAHSWGYFDPLVNSWNEELLLNNNFPIHLLPKVLQPGTIVGALISNEFFSQIPIKTSIHVCIGDLQAIMFCALFNVPNVCHILNMGTSAQLCRIVGSSENSSAPSFIPPMKSLGSIVDYDPFYDGYFIVKAASLNGGNVLQSYVNFLINIVNELTGIEITSEDIWVKLKNLIVTPSEGSNNQKSNISVLKPLLFGERHSPNDSLTLKIRHRFPSLLEMTIKLCEELVENLVQMINDCCSSSSEKFLKNHNIVCTGSVTVNDNFMKFILQKSFPNAIFISDCDADVGVTLFTFMLFTHNKINL